MFRKSKAEQSQHGIRLRCNVCPGRFLVQDPRGKIFTPAPGGLTHRGCGER